MRARTAEVAAAIGAAIFGAASIAFTLFAPTVSTMSVSAPPVTYGPGGMPTVPTTSVATSETTSLFEDGVEQALIVALILLALLFAWLVVSALLHGRPDAFRSSAPVWAPAIVLCVFVFLAGFSIGLFFLPSALFALVAAIAATAHARNLRLAAVAGT
jgi:hypothetical protein